MIMQLLWAHVLSGAKLNNFGLVARRRLFWLSGPRGVPQAGDKYKFPPSVGLRMQHTLEPFCRESRLQSTEGYSRKHVVHWSFFLPLFDPKEFVLPTSTFTSETHSERNDASAQALTRF